LSASPPDVVSGLPNITPIFWRIWLMKTMHVFVREIVGLRMRNAWLMSRALQTMCESPISPSTSERGTNAATESMTMMSTAFDLMSISAILSASSALPGWLTRRPSRSTPSRLPRPVKRVFGINKGRHAPLLLRVGHDVQGDRGLAACFRSKDLNDAARGIPRPPRAISRSMPGRNGGHIAH